MTTRDIAYAALFAALVAALGSFPGITLPAVGAPISAQSVGALLLFVVLVMLEAPLLASGRAGLGACWGLVAGSF